jgi:hypothetical protein
MKAKSGLGNGDQLQQVDSCVTGRFGRFTLIPFLVGQLLKMRRMEIGSRDQQQ